MVDDGQAIGQSLACCSRLDRSRAGGVMGPTLPITGGIIASACSEACGPQLPAPYM